MKKVINAAVCVAYLLVAPKAALCSCSCWVEAGGNYCGGGIDWPNSPITLNDCKMLCLALNPKFSSAALGDLMMTRCKNQDSARTIKPKIIRPNNAQQQFLKKISECPIGERMGAVFNVGENETIPITCPEFNTFSEKK